MWCSWTLQVRVLGVLVISERALAQDIWPSSHSDLIFAQVRLAPTSGSATVYICSGQGGADDLMAGLHS